MRWLDAVERRAWIGLLATVTGLEHAADRQLQSEAGIPFRTYGILAALSESSNQTLHMSELAGITAHSQSRLSHAVGRLERDGLITRRECGGDRRAVHATLTADGQRLLERSAPAHVRQVRELVFDRLTAEQTAALAEITRTIYDVLVEQGFALPIAALD